MTVYLIVCADVEEASQDAFDQWYESEHLSDAKIGFGAISAMRGWSNVNPRIHNAFYEFSKFEEANAILESQILKDFIKEFDRHWEGKATRTREIITIKQII